MTWPWALEVWLLGSLSAVESGVRILTLKLWRGDGHLLGKRAMSSQVQNASDSWKSTRRWVTVPG